MTRKALPLICALFAGALLWRLAVGHIEGLSSLANFSPILSLVFIGAALLPKRLAIWLPLALVMVADLVLHGGGSWSVYLCLALAGLWGLKQRGSRNAPMLLFKMVACSLGFFFITNGVCWVIDPGYPKTLGGLAQCLTVGKPGFPPTWVFFRNSLCGDLLFGAMLILLFNRQVSSAAERFVLGQPSAAS